MRKPINLLLAAALLVAASMTGAASASAAGQAPVAVAGTGSHEPPEWGLTRVLAEVAGRPLEGTFTAGLRFDAVPAPGECVDAWANFAIHDGRHWFSFVSLGEVCGQSVQAPPSTVFAVYTGEFDLYDSSRRGWTDTQGWVSIRLATDGRASVEVYAY
jgi:hypothetical protein